jgi:hypothetical protein
MRAHIHVHETIRSLSNAVVKAGSIKPSARARKASVRKKNHLQLIKDVARDKSASPKDRKCIPEKLAEILRRP